MTKLLKICFIFMLIIYTTGCDFFTTSWGKGLKKDNTESLSALPTDDLALLLSDPDYLSDPASSAELLAALGSKTLKEIQDLSLENKEAILDLTVTAGVPIETVSNLMGQAGEGNMGEILTDLVLNSEGIDVSAAAIVLTDEEVLEEADPMVIAAAALTVLVQVAANETEGVENQEEAVNDLISMVTETIADSPPGATAEDIATQMINEGTLSEESRDEIMAVIMAMQVLSGTSSTGIDRSDEVSGMPDIGGLFS